ncbi:unnamed protein product, partial [Didymodactylos carnosus]
MSIDVEKIPLSKRRFYVDKDFQLFSNGKQSKAEKAKILKKELLPEYQLSVHMQENLDEQSHGKLWKLLRDCDAQEVLNERTSLLIRGLENAYYRTQKPLSVPDISKRLSPGTPVWLYFKTTCDVKPDLKSAEIISYEQKERLRYGYRQQQQLQSKSNLVAHNTDNCTQTMQEQLTSLTAKSPHTSNCLLLSMGTFHDAGTYNCHYQSEEGLDSYEIEFRQTPQSIIIRSRPCSDYSPQDDQLYNKHLYSTVISHETIEPYIVLVYKDVQKYIDLYFPLIYAIKSVVEVTIDDVNGQTIKRTRSNRFHRFSTKVISQTSVLHVRLPMYNYSIKMINDLSSTLAENGIKLVYGNIKIEYFSPTYVSPYEHIQFSSYIANYAWDMLLSL